MVVSDTKNEIDALPADLREKSLSDREIILGYEFT